MKLQVESEKYQLYHLIYLYAKKLDSSNPEFDNRFWIDQIKFEIDKYENK